jgi:flagellin-like hook-associated protein FlgL
MSLTLTLVIALLIVLIILMSVALMLYHLTRQDLQALSGRLNALDTAKARPPRNSDTVRRERAAAFDKLVMLEASLNGQERDQLTAEEFNGVALFSAADTQIEVITSQDGAQSVGITLADLATIVGNIDGISISGANGATSTDIDELVTAVQDLADLRATNGSDQQRMTFAADMLSINKVNLESANSRIADVDIATESANLARFNILQQAGTAMLAQANQSQQSVLRLLV